MKYSIILILTLFTLLSVESRAETIQKSTPSTDSDAPGNSMLQKKAVQKPTPLDIKQARGRKKNAAGTADTKDFPTLTTGNVILGIGSLALLSTGGGETHDGEDSIEINPFTQLSVEVILYKGFGMGLNGKFRYSTTKISQSLGIINVGLSTTHLAWGVGPSLFYYYHANDRLYPYAKFTYSYGESTDKTSQLNIKTDTNRMEFTISAGLNYMVTKNIGFYGQVSHIRDIIDGVNGYYTSFDLGLKLFF